MATCPDIAYTVGRLASFLDCFQPEYWATTLPQGDTRNTLRYTSHPTNPFSSANYTTASIFPAVVAPPNTATTTPRLVWRRIMSSTPRSSICGSSSTRSAISASAVFGCSGCTVRIISQSPLAVRTSCGFADIWAPGTSLPVPCEEEQPTGVRGSYTLAPVDYSSKRSSFPFTIWPFGFCSSFYSYYNTLTRATFPAPLFGSHVHRYLISVVRRSVGA